MIAALVLGGLIGWERKSEDNRFGVKIHMLISLAAAGFSIAALEYAKLAHLQEMDADPFRVIEAVVAGVALLAAGTIIKAQGHITGLTTGVGIWLTGAIGIAAGTGFYAVAVFVSGLSFVVLYALRSSAESATGEIKDSTENATKYNS